MGVSAVRTSSSEVHDWRRAGAVADDRRKVRQPAADCAVVLLRPDGHIASWNSAAARMFGFEAAYAVGRSLACLYPSDAIEANLPERDLAEAFDLGTTVFQEAWRRRSDGTLFRATVSLGATFDSDGTHLGFVQVVQRDAAATSAAQKYAETLANADVVLRSVHDVILVQDAAGTVLYGNDAAARLFGAPDGHAMLTTPLSELINAVEGFDEHGAPVDLLDLALASDARRDSGKASLFYLRERSTNESRWWLTRFTTLRDEKGRPELMISVSTDVTDTVRSKESASFLADTTRVLSASLDYATTLRTLADALVPHLAEWASIVLFENGAPQHVALTHADPEIAARAREVWPLFLPIEEIPRAIATVLRTGEAQLHERVTEETLESLTTTEGHLTALRSFRTRSLILAPIVVLGRTEGVLALSTVEPKRQYDRNDLALAVEIGRRAGTAIEHARLYRDSQRAVRLRDEFLSIAAHELRTPLAALTLQLQSLKLASVSHALAQDAGRIPERLDKTLRQSNRLARLVDGLLDVSRIAGGQLDLHRSEVDLCTVVSGVCERFTDEGERAGSELSFSSEGPCVGSWDADRLDQVVSNLVSNAIKYGQGTPIDVRCSAEGTDGVVTVRDRGIGIAPENLERIFGRFERAVSERNYGGLGLGLWIAQEIAAAHGGHVEVTSNVGEGAVFRLVVPSRPPAKAHD
ncbi:MAG TPA: PAS domain-containing sensor histidine kinase [Labilithrix sp.]|nr:PAS domain-containing sensor histidine kinase [Labilithrix sp.]